MALLSVKYVAFLNFWVCGWNPLVWPLKWNLFRSAVLSHGTIYYLGEAPSKGFATLRNVPKLLFYGDRIGHSKSVRFRLSRPFDEVIAELVWDISRSLRVLYIISSGKPRQSHSWFLLRSRYENATPNLCWVSCAINKGGFVEIAFVVVVVDTHLPRFEALAYVLPHFDALTHVVILVSSAFIFQRFAKVWYSS